MTKSIPVNRKPLTWLAVAVALSILVAHQTVAASRERSDTFVADADIPTVAPGVDVLAGVIEVPVRIREHDYRRLAFGDSWTDENDSLGGHKGCDTQFRGGFGVLGETLREASFKLGTSRWPG